MSIIAASNIEDVIPKAPEHFDGLALDKWNELWPKLERTRIKPEFHSDIVAMYCEVYASFHNSSLQLKNPKSHVVREGGRVFQNPHFEIRDAAMQRMTELGKILGLVPGSPNYPLHGIYQEPDTAMLSDGHDEQPASEAGEQPAADAGEVAVSQPKEISK